MKFFVLTFVLKIPYLAIFRLELEKKLSCLTSAPSVCKKVIFLVKKTFLNVGPKLSYLGIFGLELEKLLYCGILYPHPQFFSNTKFSPKIKKLKYGTKSALMGCF